MPFLRGVVDLNRQLPFARSEKIFTSVTRAFHKFFIMLSAEKYSGTFLDNSQVNYNILKSRIRI